MTIFRKAAGALAACLLAATAATAGDFSTFQSLGFSPDGKVYAFEEFGVQDGSGFPYSNVYFIDTAKDAYLSGTPIRVRIDDEAADIATVRAQSRDKAKALIETHKVLSNPGVLAAFNPMGEVGADRNRIEYLQYAVEPTPGGSFALALEEIPLALSDKCRDITPDGGKGFRLKLVKRDGETADTVVHEDTRIPDSRACPLSYQVSGALTFNPLDGDPVHVALVLVRSFGFEGADGRWIAVPLPALIVELAAAARDDTGAARLKPSAPIFPPLPVLLGGALGWGALMAAGAFVSLTLQGRAENFQLLRILAIYFAGGLAAWPIALPVARVLTRHRPCETRFAAHFALLSLGTIAVTAFFFALDYRLFYAQWHHPPGTRIWLYQFVFTIAGAVYQFLVMGLSLYLPVGLPVVAGASLWLSRSKR